MPDSITHHIPAAPRPAAARPDSAARADSIARADSAAAASTLRKGIMIVDSPSRTEAARRQGTDTVQSVIISSLIVLFCVVGLRCKSNSRYLKGLLREMTEVRERNNMFDDTVRESAFLLLLNALSAGSLGVLLFRTLSGPCGMVFPAPWIAMTVCIGCTSAYTLVMPALYRGFGSIFTSGQLSAQWVRGFVAGMGLLSLVAFPCALLAEFSPEASTAALVIAAICFMAVKIPFICRAFRIFMTESSSWVLILYYLCTLEIVPLIITFVAACGLCASFS